MVLEAIRSFVCSSWEWVEFMFLAAATRIDLTSLGSNTYGRVYERREENTHRRTKSTDRRVVTFVTTLAKR